MFRSRNFIAAGHSWYLAISVNRNDPDGTYNFSNGLIEINLADNTREANNLANDPNEGALTISHKGWRGTFHFRDPSLLGGGTRDVVGSFTCSG